MKILLIVLICCIYAGLNVTGSSLIKTELTTLQREGKPLAGALDYIYFIFRPRIMLALVFIVLSMFTMFKGLSMQNFSFVVPLATGINFLITVIVGVMLFKDKMTVFQLVGLFFIISGILLVSLNAKSA